MNYSVEEIKGWAVRGEAVSPHVVLEMVAELENKNQLIELIKNRACWCIIKKAMQDSHTVACQKSTEFLNI